MIEIMRTNNPVALATAEAVLNGEGVDFFIADRHMAALEGSLGFLAPRLLVLEEDEGAARAALIAAGLGGELRTAQKHG